MRSMELLHRLNQSVIWQTLQSIENRGSARSSALLVSVLVSLGLCSCGTPATREPVKASWSDVKPILQKRCLVCHTGEHPVIMPDFTARSIVQQFIEPGNADASDLFKVLQMSRRNPTAMPPTKHYLPRNERETIRAWIDSGAQRPEGKLGELVPDPAMPRQISS